MGAIMRESDEIFFIWSSAICIISTLSPGLAYFVQRCATQTQVVGSLSSSSLSLSGHGNATYDERDAAGTHLTVLLWIQRSDFFVFRSKLPDWDHTWMFMYRWLECRSRIRLRSPLISYYNANMTYWRHVGYCKIRFL